MTTFYAACLASYNNGVLHGAHIEVSEDVNDMQEQINAMLRASKFPNVEVDCPDCEVGRRGYGVAEGKTFTGYYPCEKCGGTGKLPSAEEWCVHDWDDDTGAFSPLGETSDLKRIASIVEWTELADDELGNNGVAIVSAYWDNMGRDCMPDNARDIVDQARDAYAGEHDSLEDFAASHLEETGELDAIPENLRNYFDYAAYGRDMQLGGDVFRVGDYFFWNR
jgi:antirestriction protein